MEALPGGLQARNQAFSILPGGLFPLTPPLKSAHGRPEEADVIGGWEAMAPLGSSHLWRKEIPLGSAVYLLAPREMVWLSKSCGF